MSRIIFNDQASVSTPAAGKTALWNDNSTVGLLKRTDESGNIFTQLDNQNHIRSAGFGTATSAAFASDTYLSGSKCAVGVGSNVVGASYYAMFDMVKTAAGVATPTVIIRWGTAGAIGDSARITFTFGAGTAAADTGTFEVWAVIRTAGASGVLTGVCRCCHALAATGLTATGAAGVGIILAASSAFDMTVANSFIGISFNGGASFSGTNQLQVGEWKGAF